MAPIWVSPLLPPTDSTRVILSSLAGTAVLGSGAGTCTCFGLEQELAAIMRL